MRQFVFLLAAAALRACETIPEFLQQPSTGATAPSSSSAAPATATPTRYAPPPEAQLLELERTLSRTA